MKIKFALPSFLLGILLLFTSIHAQAEPRDWSNREGKVIQADLVSHDPVTNEVTLKLANGNEATVATDTLSDADQEWLAKRQQEIEERAEASRANAGKTVSYKSDGSEAVSYHVYYPTSFDAENPPAMIIMFSPSGNGKSILKSVQGACEALGWIGVGCDSFKNNSDEAMLDLKWREVFPHMQATVPHDGELLYLGGMSGGALRAYDYSESTAAQWKGVLAFGGWLGGKETLNCAKKMAVAIVNGDKDNGANSNVPGDIEVLEKARCEVKEFTFPGGHRIAPAPVVLEAMQWLKDTTVPGDRMSDGKRSPTLRDPDLIKVK